MAAPLRILVMGVSGSGKSAIGAALADRLGLAFQDADDLHPAANIARMRAGIPLTDQDRAPWLDACAAWLADAAGSGGVLACSALRRAYRDRLRLPPGAPAAPAPPRLVYLAVDRATLTARLATRQGHFMPATLLDSQLATLEPPTPDERPLIPPAAWLRAGIHPAATRIASMLAAPPCTIPPPPDDGAG